MQTKYKVFLFGFLISFHFAMSSGEIIPKAQAESTGGYWGCSHKAGGEWNFGRAPEACDVVHKIDPNLTKSQYRPVIFDELKDRGAERNRYMTEMYAFIREAGTYYLKKRKPAASRAEIDGFVKAFFALANQESYWSHYRGGNDQILRYMRGDLGNGHGLMQIDGRSHSVALQSGKGVALIENILYGLDIFYASWAKADSESCVTNKTDYKMRARAAWAAYNGGARKICRWANPSDPFASHDQAFNSKYQNQSWLTFVQNTTQASAISVACLAEGQAVCGPKAEPSADSPRSGQLYELADSRFCLFENGAFECVSEFRDVACLEIREGHAFSKAERLPLSVSSSFGANNADRMGLCSSVVKGFIPVGRTLEVEKPINLRASPAGAIIGSLSAKAKLVVMGFEIRNAQAQDRYYRVKSGTLDGYFYAGTVADFSTWAVESFEIIESKIGLAHVGESIQVVNKAGINLRKTAGGVLLKMIPSGSEIKVLEVSVAGNGSSVYYGIQFGDEKGFLFAGELEPKNTLAVWTRVVPPSSAKAEVKLQPELPLSVGS